MSFKCLSFVLLTINDNTLYLVSIHGKGKIYTNSHLLSLQKEKQAAGKFARDKRALFWTFTAQYELDTCTHITCKYINASAKLGINEIDCYPTIRTVCLFTQKQNVACLICKKKYCSFRQTTYLPTNTQSLSTHTTHLICVQIKS